MSGHWEAEMLREQLEAAKARIADLERQLKDARLEREVWYDIATRQL